MIGGIIVNLTITNLEKCFKRAKERSMPFVGVKIQIEGFERPEVIINPYENFDSKLEYYKKAYNDDLTLKAFNGIKIISFTCGDNYSDIQSDLAWMEG